MNLMNNYNQLPNDQDAKTISDTVSQLTKVSRVSQVGGAKNGDKLKMCMRIWSGFSKFIRSQCNKERIIDSLYFGTFYKKDTYKDTKNPYVFVTESARNTFSDIKVVVNDENYETVPA